MTDSGYKPHKVRMENGVQWYPAGIRVLGPILCLFYINSLPASVKLKIILFADDAKLYREINNDSDVKTPQKRY